jgi:hypothetical protein
MGRGREGGLGYVVNSPDGAGVGGVWAECYMTRLLRVTELVASKEVVSVISEQGLSIV